MEDKLKKFQTIRDQVRQEIVVFPQNKRGLLLFGTWNLKDVIAHLNNWMIHDIDCLNAVRENKIPYWEPDVDEFNKKGVDLRKNYSWEELLQEFNQLSDKLLDTYSSYPRNLLSIKIWPDRDETPRKFLKEDIDHWTLELENIQSKKI